MCFTDIHIYCSCGQCWYDVTQKMWSGIFMRNWLMTRHQKHSHRWLNSFRAAFKNSDFHTFTDFLGLNNKLDIKECRQLTIIYTCYEWSLSVKARQQCRSTEKRQRSCECRLSSCHTAEIISISVLGPSSVSSGIIKVDQIQSNLLWRTQTKHKLVSVRNDWLLELIHQIKDKVQVRDSFSCLF